MSNVAKTFLGTSLSVLHNYFANSTKILYIFHVKHLISKTVCLFPFVGGCFNSFVPDESY